MDAKELMIGDWVVRESHKKTPQQVIGIGDKGVTLKLEGGWCGEAIDLIEPIPLTPEMLTNNGFTLENKNKYPRRYRLNLNTHCGDYIIVDFDCYNQLSKKNWSFPIQMCMLVGNDRFCENFVRIYQYDYLYVHQLQHALRLAGINKEIVL